MARGGLAVNVAAFESAAKEKHLVAAAEMAVETIHFLVVNDQILAGVALGVAFRFHTGRGGAGDGAAKFRGDADQGALEQAALVQIADQLGDGAVDLFFHFDHALAAVFVHVEALERPVLIFDLDIARAGLRPGGGPANSPGRIGCRGNRRDRVARRR